MNEEFIKFIQLHNIDIDTIYEDLQIYNEREINSIIADYKLDGQTSTEIVCIADILGYDYSWKGLSNNLAKNFHGFFGNQDSYHSRSLGMLKYGSNDIIEKLSRSFTSEPIKTLELEDGKKVISVNGLHRYTLLRIHYINELNKVKGNEDKEEELKQKYSIPIEVTKVDLLKTYCNYIISFVTHDSVYISNEYDDNYKRTGKVKLSSKNETITLDDAQLIEYTKKIIRSLPQYIEELLINDINISCEYYNSFKLFIDTYFSEEIILLSKQNSKKGRGFSDDII